MQQAQNYASLPDINATYAVATNGDQWHVQRRIDHDWAHVMDLPDFRHGREAADWLQILATVNTLSPVLFWLGKTVPAKNAPTYFTALQKLFYCPSEVNLSTDRHLRQAADNLLRVLVSVTKLSGYTHGKLGIACKSLNEFWADRSTDLEIDSGDFWKMVHDANAYVSLYLQDGKHPEIIDLAAMRLISAMLAYLSGLKSPRRIRYTDVTDTVQREVRNYINLSLITRFNAALPDPLDEISLNDIRTLCKPTWDAMHK